MVGARVQTVEGTFVQVDGGSEEYEAVGVLPLKDQCLLGAYMWGKLGLACRCHVDSPIGCALSWFTTVK